MKLMSNENNKHELIIIINRNVPNTRNGDSLYEIMEQFV